MLLPLRLQSTASLAAERDEQHSSRLRHLQRAHQTALEHARPHVESTHGPCGLGASISEYGPTG